MITVAIDGPSGAGKSTIAKEVAKAKNLYYVDTGAFYRAIGLYSIQNGLEPGDREIIPLLDDLSLQVENLENQQQVLLNGEDVTDKIRNPEMSSASSKVSSIPEVRQWLMDGFRNLALERNVIMDGRDIGTVVLPNAAIKIFLTADPEERAQRRYRDYIAKGDKVEYNKVLEDIIQRDKRDSQREVAPLKQADDATLLDSTSLNFDQTVAAVLNIINDWEEQNVL